MVLPPVILNLKVSFVEKVMEMPLTKFSWDTSKGIFACFSHFLQHDTVSILCVGDFTTLFIIKSLQKEFLISLNRWKRLIDKN